MNAFRTYIFRKCLFALTLFLTTLVSPSRIHTRQTRTFIRCTPTSILLWGSAIYWRYAHVFTFLGVFTTVANQYLCCVVSLINPSDPKDVSITFRKAKISHHGLEAIAPNHFIEKGINRMSLERVWKYLSNESKTIVQLKSYKLLRHFEVFGFKKIDENFEIFKKILRVGKVKIGYVRFSFSFHRRSNTQRRIWTKKPSWLR